MSRLSDSHHFRKTVAGMCMIGAPLLLLVGVIVHPESKSDVGAQLAVIADNMDAWYAAHLIVAVALVPAGWKIVIAIWVPSALRVPAKSWRTSATLSTMLIVWFESSIFENPDLPLASDSSRTMPCASSTEGRTVAQAPE